MDALGPGTGALGIIAGEGRFPILIAEQARRAGISVVALAVPGVTDESLSKIVPTTYLKLGQLSKAIKAFQDAGVKRAVMAGKIQHVSLFGGILPDLRAAKVLARLPDKRTDTILRAVADEFQKDGIELLSCAACLPHLLSVRGPMTRRKPSREEWADMRLGWRAAKALAGMDVGQTVVVSGCAVVAIEAMEGTDACIRRARDLARSKGANPSLTVVKVAKPRQDLRFDMPVMGLDSLRTFEEAGVAAVALEANRSLIFDKDRFLAEADDLKLAVCGAADEDFPP